MCKFPDCEKVSSFTSARRGLCCTHHRLLLNMVKKGRSTWEEIKNNILA
jgi:hypothetical protein